MRSEGKRPVKRKKKPRPLQHLTRNQLEAAFMAQNELNSALVRENAKLKRAIFSIRFAIQTLDQDDPLPDANGS